jgi:hypothetical protein
MECESRLDIHIAERQMGTHDDTELIGSCLVRILNERGHRATLIRDGKLLTGRNQTLVFVGNIFWFPHLRRSLECLPRRDRPHVVVWHYEPLPPPDCAGLPRPRLTFREIAKILLRDRRGTDVYTNYRTIRELHRKAIINQLVVTTRGRQDFLAERGIASEWVPLGYAPHHGRSLELNRDIDVLFLGVAHVPRRQRILKRMESMGLQVVAKGDWHAPDCWGEARTRLLNRTKILLNFPRTEGEMSGLRFILGMSNKALVVSEPVYRPDPYTVGTHFLSAAIDDIPDLVGHYLKNEGARAKITEAAFEHLHREVTLERMAEQLVGLLERGHHE